MTDSNIKIVCSWHGTRNGFKHVATVFDGDCCVSTATARYINRTWEAYPYQKAIQRACHNWKAECEARIFSSKKLETGLLRLSAKRKAEALEEAKKKDTEYAKALLLEREADDGSAMEYIIED